MRNRRYVLLLLSVVVFSGGGEEYIAAGVEGCLYAVLYHTDDEANSNGLHRHVVANIEERAGHGDEQQRSACDT